jgi:hypothetical protein
MEIILSFPQDKKLISLNESIHRDFGIEQLDDRLCKNCNNSYTLEVTTSIHTHPYVLIIMLKRHEYINNKPWLGNPFGIPWNSAINPIPDLLNSGIFIGILFF